MVTSTPAVARCPHCGAPVEGCADEFCCHGCELAWTIIHGAGLEKYYDERRTFAPRPEPVRESWDAVPADVSPDGTAQIKLMIDGLRCASCVWVTERVLERMPGVHDATVSYATGRATLRWDPTRIGLHALAERIATLGYRPRLLGEDNGPDTGLLIRLGVATFAAMNIMLISVSIYAGWFSDMAPRFVALFRWYSLALSTPVALWAAEPFYRGAWRGLRHGMLHMDVPIALAIAVLYTHGVFATLAGSDTYLDSLAMLVALLLAGRLLEARGRSRAAEAATALAATAPATARRHASHNGGIESVATADLIVGDRIDVGAGQDIPVDGMVLEGAGQISFALLTGESAPVAVRPGDRVVAGAVVEDGAFTLTVEAVGEATMLGRMASEVRSAADRGVRPTSTDRIAPWFTTATLAIGAATFATWWTIADVHTGLITAVAVLVVACPCALALSRPLGAAAGLGAAARRGLMLRSADALLEFADIDTVALDKTGTATGGTLEVVDADDDAVRIAAGLERFSVHPIARAIMTEATRRNIPIPKGMNVRESAGRGITGNVGEETWSVTAGAPGHVVLERSDGQTKTIKLGDQLRADTADAVRALKKLNLEVVLLTGDHQSIADRFARAAGITSVEAEVSPEAKSRWIRERMAKGHRVLFAGDGINDGPGLTAASVGIAMGTGAASSVLTADGVVASGSLKTLVAGVRAARACRHVIRMNQLRSIVYNVSAVTAAAAGLINPLVAAILMPLSSGLVIWGSSRIETHVTKMEAT